MVVAVYELLQRRAFCQQRFQQFIQFGFNLRIHVASLFRDAVVGADTHRPSVRADGNDADVSVAHVAFHQLAHLLRFRRFVEAHLIVAAAREVNALAQSAYAQEACPQHYEYDSAHSPRLVTAHEVEVCVLQYATRQLRLERQVLPLVFLHKVVVHQTGQVNSREERDGNTDNLCRGESADGTRTEVEQDDTGDDRCKVGVEDGRESVLVTILQGHFNRLTIAKLLFRAFVNQHVCVHRHTDGQHHTCNTTHGQCCLERCQDTERKEHVQQQGSVHHHAGDETVHGAGVNHQQNKGHYARDEAGLDGGSAQRRAYDIFLHDVRRSGHLTGTQHVGQVLGLVRREGTRDY